MQKSIRTALSCFVIFSVVTSLSSQVQAQAAQVEAPVYAALGGQPGVQAIVADLVEMVLSDERIKDTFRDVDLVRLRRTLAEQFCVLAGGPCTYTGKPMDEIHEDLKITNAQFNALAEDLQIVMERRGVPFSAQNKLVAKLAPMQKSIVTK